MHKAEALEAGDWAAREPGPASRAAKVLHSSVGAKAGPLGGRVVDVVDGISEHRVFGGPAATRGCSARRGGGTNAVNTQAVPWSQSRNLLQELAKGRDEPVTTCPQPASRLLRLGYPWASETR